MVALLSGHTNEHSGVIDPNGFDYEVWLYDVNVAAGGSIDVNGSGLGVDETLVVDGRDEKDGSLRIFGGAAGDTLYGGAGSDMLFGGLGSDVLIGGEGADLYVFRRAPESTSTAFDRIEGFDWTVDRIDAPGNATRAFSQSAQGALSLQSFDTDLAAGLSGVLGPEQAALFTASTGDLSGQLFAVIDVNGIDGYQAGEDLVIRLATGILPIDPNAFIIV